MFDLFRFVMLRPAGTREPHEIISTADDTDFQQQLERDRERPSPGGQMEQTADRFLESQRAVRRVDSLALAKQYDALSAALHATPPANRADLLREIRQAFDRDAGDVVQEQGFGEDRRRLADTLIAAKLGTPRIDLPLDLVARDLRLIALIQRAADGDGHLDEADGIRAALGASIALPDGLLPLDQPSTAPVGEGGERPPGERPPEGSTDERQRQREQALREYRDLSEAHDYLRDLSAEHVGDVGGSATTTPVTPGEGGTERPSSHDPGEIHEAIFREIHALRDALDVHRTVAEGVVASAPVTSATQILQGTTLRVRREVLTEASETVHAGLRAARVDLMRMSLSDAVERIDARRRELAPLVLDDLTGAAGSAGGSNVSLVGGQLLPTSQVPDLTMRDARRHDA